MSWKDELSVGIGEIDEHHKTLSGCIASLEEAVAGQKGCPAVRSAVDRLANSARIHFAVEECLMRLLAFPELLEHSLEHFRFSEELKRLQQMVLTADPSQESIALLRTWLHRHVATSDRKYAFHFLRRSV